MITQFTARYRTRSGIAILSLMVLVAAGFLASCTQQQEAATDQVQTGPVVTRAVAVLYPTEGNTVDGTVIFQKVEGGIKITADITGLTPGRHGFHIHEKGDCSAPDGTSAGGHFAPMHNPHGAPTDQQRHAGDLGNITADSTGAAHLEWTDPVMSFEGPTGIIGRGVIVHAGEDDLTSQPTGAAGARVACGVIGVAETSDAM